MNARTERLRALMAQHNLTSRQVGEILKRSTHTVRCWRSRWEDRAIPEHALALLEIRLAERAR
ncbi:helix-turn-helix domain-containing protein [Bradyrhizobium sp. 613_E4_N2_2]|uniref:helix-turn-helix domain-containing protein n=1 Tax=Bradyrhizobium sp. 613_E4_N2_2 TaxID=3240371 RepID=UPI003F8C8C83